MASKLIQQYKLNKWNIATISIYILISYFCWVYFSIAKNPKNVLFAYALGTHFFLYLFQYKALRNFNYFLIWIVIGVAHLALYFDIESDQGLAFVNGHAATGLRNTIILLGLFQLLRYASLKIQHVELVCPSRGNDHGLFDNRKSTIVDTICGLVYFGVSLGLLFI